jgi:hypothetical protein
MCMGKAHWYYTVAWVVAMGILADVAEGSGMYVAKGFRKSKSHVNSWLGIAGGYRTGIAMGHRSWGVADDIVHVVANGYRKRASQMLLY